MADQKLTALTAVSDLADTDLLYAVDGVGGTPASKKVAFADLRGSTFGPNVTVSQATTAAELQAEIDALDPASTGSGGVLLVYQSITINQTITVPADVEFRQQGNSLLTVADTVTVGINFVESRRTHHVVNIERDWLADRWDQGNDSIGSVGVRLTNCRFLLLELRRAENFTIGLSMYGDAGGTVDNRIQIGRILTCKVGVKFHGVNAGFANQNTFVGGAIRLHSSQSGIAGTRYVDLSETGNGNTFVGVNLENDSPEYNLIVKWITNVFVNCRFESPNAVVFLPESHYNMLLLGSYNFGPDTAAFDDQSGRNYIVGRDGVGVPEELQIGMSTGQVAKLTANDVLRRRIVMDDQRVIEWDDFDRAVLGSTPEHSRAWANLVGTCDVASGYIMRDTGVPAAATVDVGEALSRIDVTGSSVSTGGFGVVWASDADNWVACYIGFSTRRARIRVSDDGVAADVVDSALTGVAQTGLVSLSAQMFRLGDATGDSLRVAFDVGGQMFSHTVTDAGLIALMEAATKVGVYFPGASGGQRVQRFVVRSGVPLFP